MKKLSTIKNIYSKMPKSITEAINFNDIEMEGDEMDMGMDVEMNEPVAKPMVQQDSNMNANELIIDIRKKALKAMADLADTPEDTNYEVLKKIFMMLDKAVSEKQEQGEVISKSPNVKNI